MLDEVLRCRIEGGFPVQRAEMGIGSLEAMNSKWPDSVEAVERQVPSWVTGSYDDYEPEDDYYDEYCRADFDDDYMSD